MRSPEEQIKAILSSQVDLWAKQQLLPGQSMKNLKYSDFVNVTFADIKRYVNAHGFPFYLYACVYEEGDLSSVLQDAQTRISFTDGKWKVYYSERGGESQIAYFPTREEARSEVIARLIRLAKILLNAPFRQAHPELSLPSPDEME